MPSNLRTRIESAVKDRPWLQDKRVLFSAKFFVFFAVAHWLILAAPLAPLLEWMAALQGSWLDVPVEGVYLFVQSGAFVITNSCTGLVSWIILGSVIFALRKPSLPRKTAMFFGGLLILFPLNLLRVAVVVWTGVAYDVHVAEAVHIASWFLMSAAVLGIWYFFSARFSGVKEFYELL